MWHKPLYLAEIQYIGTHTVGVLIISKQLTLLLLLTIIKG